MSNRRLAVTGGLLLLLLRSVGALGRRRTKMSSTVAFWSFQLLGRMFHINWWTRRREDCYVDVLLQSPAISPFVEAEKKDETRCSTTENSTLSHFFNTALMRVTLVVHSCLLSYAYSIHWLMSNKRFLLSITLKIRHHWYQRMVLFKHKAHANHV